MTSVEIERNKAQQKVAEGGFSFRHFLKNHPELITLTLLPLTELSF